MLGADYARGPLTVGLSVGRTLGLGGYSGPSTGQMTTSMTGLYPWAGDQVTDRVSVWGVTGYGTKAMSLTPGSADALETGVSTAMTAETTNAIDRDAAGSRLRRAIHLMEEMTDGATALPELLPLLRESPIRMIPFAERVRLATNTGEVEFQESSEVWVAVAERVLPSWARAVPLTCIRMAGDSMEATDAALAVVDSNIAVASVVRSDWDHLEGQLLDGIHTR